MRSRLQPYSFSVFIARRSGSRFPRDPPLGRTEKIKLPSNLWSLATTDKVAGDPELQTAQYALRACRHLTSEMLRAERTAPEVIAIAGRSVVEHALVGSYLAMYRESPGGTAGLLKKQRRAAARLRDYFLQGDMTGALSLLPEVSFIVAPLSTELEAATGAPDLRMICELLDRKEPFASGNIATVIYNETYSPLSNFVVHSNPQSLERYRNRGKFRREFRGIFPPTPLVRVETLVHSVEPAVGGLCASLARALDLPFELYDMWLREAISVDGYEWSGSIARSAAIQGLVELVGLPSVYALNAAGFATRILAVSNAMANAQPNEQLIAACELIDLARTVTKWPRQASLRIWAAHSLLNKPTQLGPGEKTSEIARGPALTHPQALLAALALVYAGLWPDNPEAVDRKLDEFDQAAPHQTGALDRIRSQFTRQDLRVSRRRWKAQVTRLP